MKRSACGAVLTLSACDEGGGAKDEDTASGVFVNLANSVNLKFSHKLCTLFIGEGLQHGREQFFAALRRANQVLSRTMFAPADGELIGL